MRDTNITGTLTFKKSIQGLERSLVESKLVLTIAFHLCILSASGMAVGSETHGVHIHGVASLSVAFEKGAMEIQLEAPAMSLLGFEHKPRTQAQFKTIDETKTRLNSFANVMSIDGPNCSLDSLNVEISGPAGQSLKVDHGHKHGHHDSAEQYDESHSKGESHSEVSAIYRFQCVGDDELRSFKVLLFNYFIGLEKINVNWVTETRQGRAVLRPELATVELR